MTTHRKRLAAVGALGVVVLVVAVHLGLGGAVFAAPAGWAVGIVVLVIVLKVGAIVVAGRHGWVRHRRVATGVVRAEGRVATPKAERYAKQLCGHAAWKARRAEWTPPTGVIEFPDGMGTCRVTAAADQLVIVVESADPANLARIQGIIGRNIERFAGRDGLTVEWVPVAVG